MKVTRRQLRRLIKESIGFMTINPAHQAKLRKLFLSGDTSLVRLAGSLLDAYNASPDDKADMFKDMFNTIKSKTDSALLSGNLGYPTQDSMDQMEALSDYHYSVTGEHLLPQIDPEEITSKMFQRRKEIERLKNVRRQKEFNKERRQMQKQMADITGEDQYPELPDDLKKYAYPDDDEE